MKIVRIWPTLVVLFWLVIKFYYIIVPCRDGIFIGGCGLGDIFLLIWLILSLIIYSLISLLIIRKYKGILKFRVFFVIGLVSLLLAALLPIIAPSFILIPIFSLLEAIWP